MNQNQLVSVYINVYNREDLIGETIQSVLNQTYSNLQIIVVDDGSSDGTADVVRSFADPRIEFYPLGKNINVVGALNEGLKHVRGDYAAHVDSDDLWAPDKIEKQVRFLEEHPEYGSCFSLVQIIDETGTESEGNEVINRELFHMENMTQAEMLRYFYDQSNHLNHSSMLVRKSMLDQTGGYDPTKQYLHDFDLWVRFCLQAPVYILQEPLVAYRVHSGNYSSPETGRDNAYQWEFAQIMQNMIDRCPAELFSQAFADKRKTDQPLTSQILEIEKAFVLMDAFSVNAGNRILGIQKLDALFAQPEYRKILEDVYGFTQEDLYRLHRENVYYNVAKTQHLKDLVQIGEDNTAYLEGQVKILEETIANRDQQIEQSQELIRQLSSHKKSKLSKAIGKVGSVYSKKLKNGEKAKKKLMLYGFYGHNLGDDMFFDMLFRRYPDVLFAVCDSSAYANLFAKYNNVRLYAADSASAIRMNLFGEKLGIKNLYETIVRSSTDGGVHFGGSIYQQIGNWEQDLKDREKRKQKGKCFFGISNNFGPYHTEDYKEFWRKQFQTWNDVCFRDRYSYDLFSDIASVRYAPDALFAYSDDPAGDDPQEELDRPKRLAISVINLRWELRQIDPEICDAYEDFLYRLVEEGLQNGFEIVLLSFCELQEDSAAMRRIVDRCKEKDPEAAERIRMELYYDQIDSMMRTIAQCDYILATRFHAMVLGYVLGKKVLPLCYSNKMTNVLEDLKLADRYLDIRKPDEYPADHILHLFAEADREKIEKIRENAADQFLKLDQYLK
ncbi:MAG: glycosyltransferase [Lachnospiraceae bacterium]|nr:glycosyltransferase [Lachnospiraceae bacterium]